MSTPKTHPPSAWILTILFIGQAWKRRGERRTGARGSGNNLSELGTDEDTESRRKQENFADMKQAVREVLQELGIVSQEAPGAGDIAEDIRSGEKPDTVHLSSNGLDADTESVENVKGTEEILITPLGNKIHYVRRFDGSKKTGDSNFAKLAAAIPALESMKSVAVFTGDEIVGIPGKRSDIALKIFDQLGGKVARDGFGDVLLDKYGAKGIATGAHHPNDFKIISLFALPEIIGKGEMVFADDTRHPGKLGYMFAAPVTIMGKRIYVGEVVHKMIADGKIKYYLTDMVDEDGWSFTVYTKKEDTNSSKGRFPSNSEVDGDTVVPSEDKLPQENLDVKPKESQINVDTL